MKPEMRSLLDNLNNVGDLTYVGVGSAIHDLPGLDNKSDQILPLFIKEMLSSGTRVTAIHFDPMFKIDVMKEYFKYVFPRLQIFTEFHIEKGFRTS